MNVPKLINSGFKAFKANDLAMCENLCRQVLARFPDNPDGLHLLGLVRYRQGKPDRAVALISKALEQQPDTLKFISNLGVMLQENGQLHDALTQYRRLVRLDPGSATGFNNLGTLLKDLGEMQKAETAFREAFALAPENPDILGNLGLCLQLQGRISEAIRYMKKSMRNSCDPVQPHNYGLLLKILDQREAAKTAQLKALQIDPNFAPAWLYLVHLNHYNSPQHPDLQTIKQLLGRPGLTDKSREHLHFALGKCLDDCGNYDAASRHFQAGNRLMSRSRPYNRDEFEQQASRTITAFTAEFIRKHQLEQRTGSIPVFIIGLPRSGKTRLERQLGKLPGVHSCGEFWALPGLSVRLLAKHRGGYPPRPGIEIRPEELLKAAHCYQDAANEIAPGSRYVTNTLPVNSNHAGLIATLFPHARIISCIRDPLDTRLSIYCKHYSGTSYYASRQDDIRWYMHQHDVLMQHWRSVLPSPMLEVRYEDLVTDPAKTLQQVADYCAIPVTDSQRQDWNHCGMQKHFIGHAQHYRELLENAD